MTDIITRAGKGSALSHAEMDTRQKQGQQTKAIAYTVATTDNRDTIEYSGAGSVDFTMPDASATATASDTGDFEVTIKHVGTGTLGVTCTTGADTIDGSTNDLTLETNDTVTLKINQAGDGYNIIAGETLNSVTQDNTVTLTNKTLTSPVIDTAISGTAFLDEDTLVSDSATKVASQQSIKAYVDINKVTILDTPVLLATSTATASVAKANLDITAHTTGVALKAIVRVKTEFFRASSTNVKTYVGEPDETFSALHTCTYGTGTQVNDSNTVVTNLKTGELFAWEIVMGATVATHNTTVHLIGYYT